MRTQNGTSRAAEILVALAGPQRPRKRRHPGPSPPLPGRLPVTTFAEQRNSNSRSSRRKRWKATPTALPLPASGRRSDSGSCSGGLGDFFFFSWHHQGLTQVGATETEKELRDPNLGIRDRGGRVMSLPLSTPVSGCSCLSLPGDRVYATSGREITVFIEFRLA